MFRRLAEADTGIEHDPVMGNAGAPGDFERTREEIRHVGDDVDRRIGGIAVVHDNDGYAVRGNDARHVGVALQAPHVVDDCRAGFQRPSRNGGFHRIDRHRDANRRDSRQDRLKPSAFFFHRYRTHAAIGPRRLGADIDDVGTFGDHAPCVFDGHRRLQEAPAVRERIRSDIEHAHDPRILLRQQPMQQARVGCGTGCRSRAKMLLCGRFLNHHYNGASAILK